MNQVKIVSWCRNRTLHWIFSSWLVSILYTLLRAYEKGGVNWGTLLYCLLDTALLYEAAVARMIETEVLYSPSGLPGYSKSQAETVLRSHCDFPDRRSDRED